MLNRFPLRLVLPLLLLTFLLLLVAGALLFLQRTTDIETDGAVAITDSAVILGIASLVLAAFFAVLLRSLIDHRVRRLVKTAGHLAAGNLDARAQLAGGDELALIGAAYDRMADRVADSISDRRKSEERLRDLLEMNQKLIAAPNLGILVYKADGPCVLVNGAAARMVGATVEQLRAQNFRNIASWQRSGMLAAAEQTVADGRSRELQTHMVTTFGRNLSVWCMFSRFESRGKMHLLLLMNDTTERHKAEAELGLRSAALEAAANTVMITDREGTICWVNEAFTTLTGYTAEEAIGRNPRLLKSGMHDQAFYRQMYETVLGGSVWRGEIINRYKDGRIGHEAATVTPVPGDDGTPTHFIAIKEDITQRRAAEEALVESEEKFRAIFDGATDGIVLADPDTGQLRDANPRLCEMIGYAHSEIPALNIRELHPEAERARVVTEFRDVAAGTRDEPGLVTVRRKDGEELPVEITGRRIDIAGRPYVLGLFRDISDRQQKELALRAKAVAEQAALEKSMFLANMSHELRTPLNAIVGFSETLAEALPPNCDDEALEDIGSIRKAARHLSHLIDDILNLSRLEAGKLELAAERFPVAGLVDEIAETVGPLVGNNANTLRVDCDPDTGDARTDPTRVRQVLLNLLSNAAKFTTGGRIDLICRRRNGNEGDLLVFEVHDTGIGMSAAELERLFQPFVQAKSAGARRQQGSGLGLAISRRIAELLGGDIAVRSRPGEGSAFTFSVPATLPGQ